jgi:peptidoglycan/xylan/chitin deacetylase (PgdA/CDA1 family)
MEVIREIVYYDPVPPELTLHGETSITLSYGQKYEEPGYSASDNCDGDITDRVTISGFVDTKKAGTYKITYTVEDSYGNTDTQVRTVQVKPRKPSKPAQPAVIPSGRIIYLTFDDGPSAHTERLLSILRKYNVKATFFVMNTAYTHLLDDIVNQGHSIAAHSYTHSYREIYASEEAYFTDLNKILSTIESCTGVQTKLIRFPGGSSNTVSRFNEGIMSRLTNEVVERGYRYFDWNVSSGDAGGAKTADKVFENVIDGISNKQVSIVLQHDTKEYSVDAVERIIVWALENGYTFLPLKSDSPTAAHGVQN